mgnify:FL=1
MAIEDFTRTYTSFSGSDMVATCNILGENIVLGTLQTISYSLHMDRRAVRAIGNVNPKEYTQGPRTIAGTLVFAVFDKHMMYHMAEQFAKKDNTYKNNAYTALYDKYKSFTQERHILSDELPPFDVTITLANEYGNRAKIAIYNIQLVNEGQVMSISDIYTENTYQFVALDIDYLRSDDPSFKYEEDDEEVEDNTPQVSVSKDYNLLDTISIEHISHDYLNSTSLMRITKNSVQSNVRLNDGILYIKDANSQDQSYREYPIPSSNSNVYNKVLRLENGLYKAYFQENITDLQSNEIQIYIHDEDRGYRPVIENIVYIDSIANDNPLERHFCFKIRSLCSSIYGHNKLYIKNNSTNNTDVYDINDSGYTLVPITSFTVNTEYIIYSGRQSSDSSSFAEQSISHLFKFKYNIDIFNDESMRYTIMSQLYHKNQAILIDLFNVPQNTNREIPFSAQAILMSDYLLTEGACFQSDIDYFVESIQTVENNLMAQLNGLDKIAVSDNVYCVSKVSELYNNNKPYTVSVNDFINIYNDKPEKFISKYTVYYYYDLNKDKNEVCSCLQMKMVDRRGATDEYN